MREVLVDPVDKLTSFILVQRMLKKNLLSFLDQGPIVTSHGAVFYVELFGNGCHPFGERAEASTKGISSRF